eukprot:3995465-Pleurochrysis_carterae.AAC.3
MICHGATPRRFEPDPWRSTTDAGAPCKRLIDDSGVPVPSINDLSRPFSRPLEQKLTPHDLANYLALLNHARAYSGACVGSHGDEATARGVVWVVARVAHACVRAKVGKQNE